MKILENILNVYLFILVTIALLFLILSPMILSEYLQNENYLWLFFVNLPILIGFLYAYIDNINGGCHAGPRRMSERNRNLK
jgi:hypothetical protein